MVTREIKSFQNCFSLRQCVETCPKLFQNLIAVREYFPTRSMSVK